MTFSAEKSLNMLRQGTADRDLRHSMASGILPLGPAQILEALLLLTGDSDSVIKEEAIASLKKVPKSMVLGVCTSEESSPGLLDRLARLFSRNSEILETLIVNANILPETAVYIASLSFPAIIEMAARNHQLISRAPAMLDAMKSNPRTPKYLLALWEEEEKRRTGAAVSEEETDGSAEGEQKHDSPPEEGSSPTEVEGETDESPVVVKAHVSITQTIRGMSAGEKVALAMKGNAEARKILIREKNRLICEKVLGNPSITDSEVEAYAKSTNVSKDVLRFISKKREWIKLPAVVNALVTNPATPLGISVGFLRRMGLKQLEGLSKNRNIPEALRNMAKKMAKQKAQKQGR